MTKVARIAAAIIAAALSCFSFQASAAEELTNVKNFDANLLIGKTCIGTFTTGGNFEGNLGAVQITFFLKNSLLSGNFKRKNGKDAFENPKAVPESVFEDLGELRKVQIENQKVFLTNNANVDWNMVYDEGKLIGDVDPSRSGRSGAKPAKGQLVCS